MKELDELITYIENDLIGENPNIEIIDEAIKRYAELYHKKQLELYIVSQQRELLKTFCEYIGADTLVNKDDMLTDIDEHIRVFNCC